MVLHTAKHADKEKIIRKLESNAISYLIMDVNITKINVFFGDTDCVDVIRSFGEFHLSKLSDEQDFILGALLGYDIAAQCRRYLERLSKKQLNSDCFIPFRGVSISQENRIARRDQTILNGKYAKEICMYKNFS